MPCILKARLHRRFLSRQLDAIFVALKLHQVSNTFEPPAISRRLATLARQKLHRVAATKIACVNGPLNRTNETLLYIYIISFYHYFAYYSLNHYT